MIERIKNSICHPRFIGKYNKDKVSKIILVIMIFFVFYLLIFGIRTFSENPMGEGAENYVVSEVISKQDHTVVYDSETHTLKGNSFNIQEETFGLYVLPFEDSKSSSLVVNIVLGETKGYIYYGDIEVSAIDYADIKVEDFTFDGISKNNSKDIYNFRIFVFEILESGFTFFRILNFIEGALITFVTFMMLFLVSFIFARMINPTIEGKVRAKLVLYDVIIFLVCSMLASLFNVGWIVYIGYSLPLIYTTITFKHIIRVVIPKR